MAEELGEIVFEPVGGDADVDAEEVAVEVERILIRDEARIMRWVSLVAIVVGVLFAIGWFFVAWRTQMELEGGSRSSFTGLVEGDPDLVDRIVALEQIGFVLLFALGLVIAGSGLRLYAGRVNADRVA